MTTKRLKPGFTLIELLVAMSITVILLGVLVYITGISMDTYKSSRNEVRASRQAKEAIEAIAKDLESLVTRRDGNPYEWIYAGEETSDLTGPNNREIVNHCHLIFFTAATDRYKGEIGNSQYDKGGDVSAVSYRLVYRDQILDTDEPEYAVFSLYRNLVNPNEAFDLLAVDDLEAAYASAHKKQDLEPSHFLVENIYEFTVTFLIQYLDEGTQKSKIERVTLSQKGSKTYSEFRFKGDGIDAEGGNANLIEEGEIVGAEVSITVLTDRGVTLAKKSGLSREELLKKHSYHYSKTINTPRP